MSSNSKLKCVSWHYIYKSTISHLQATQFHFISSLTLTPPDNDLSLIGLRRRRSAPASTPLCTALLNLRCFSRRKRCILNTTAKMQSLYIPNRLPLTGGQSLSSVSYESNRLAFGGQQCSSVSFDFNRIRSSSSSSLALSCRKIQCCSSLLSSSPGFYIFCIIISLCL